MRLRDIVEPFSLLFRPNDEIGTHSEVDLSRGLLSTSGLRRVSFVISSMSRSDQLMSNDLGRKHV